MTAKLNNRILYETPVGTFATWEEAAAACERADFDACTCITQRQENFHTVGIEWAYGSYTKLTNQIRVF